jgi:hypothetical protein
MSFPAIHKVRKAKARFGLVLDRMAIFQPAGLRTRQNVGKDKVYRSGLPLSIWQAYDSYAKKKRARGCGSGRQRIAPDFG